MPDQVRERAGELRFTPEEAASVWTENRGLPLAAEDVAPLQRLQKTGLKLYGCIAGAKQKIYETDFRRPSIIAIGGEKRGLSGAVRSICDGLLTIPTAADPSSLSLSHAGAIVMAEAMRQRLPENPENAA